MMSPMPGNVRRSLHETMRIDHVGSAVFFLEQSFFRAVWEWFHSWCVYLFIYLYLFVYFSFIYFIYIYIQCIHLHIRYIGGLLYVKATLQKAHDARDAYCESPNLSINSN